MQILEHNFVEFVYFVAETYIYTNTFLLLSSPFFLILFLVVSQIFSIFYPTTTVTR